MGTAHGAEMPANDLKTALLLIALTGIFVAMGVAFDLESARSGPVVTAETGSAGQLGVRPRGTWS